MAATPFPVPDVAPRPRRKSRQFRLFTLALTITCAIGILVVSWLFRFNDPGGSFAGLTDDHFFYVIRGWQILYGDLPVRDFVDHGAPLYFYIAAGVQSLFGRGTLSELAFSVTMLSVGAAGTFLLATRASGWIAAGLAGVLLHILLEPRFYNYPKILVYVAAVPALWWYADRPGGGTRFLLAAITVIGFLLRHDHGLFVAIAFAALLVALRDTPVRARVREATLYGATVLALLLPYFVFVQMNGGIVSYFAQASAWAARDRERAPVVWPGLFDYPNGVPEAVTSGGPFGRGVAAVRANMIAWMYYFQLALPLFALAVLAIAKDAARPGWRRASAKLAVVAVLGIALNAGFLRSPLGARLADPSVPHAILVAWLAIAVPALIFSRRSWQPSMVRWIVPARTAVGAIALLFAFVIGTAVTTDLYQRLAKANLVEGPRRAFAAAAGVADNVRTDWRLASWAERENRPDLMRLVLYLSDCTPLDARVFVQPYIPQVLPLARRGFAGGHADLRPGFFTDEAAQRLTLERLQRQNVPIALLETGDALANFRASFPLISAYLDQHYQVGGTHTFDERFGITLLVRNDAGLTGRDDELGWPCFP
jgi:hypothetical protein